MTIMGEAAHTLITAKSVAVAKSDASKLVEIAEAEARIEREQAQHAAKMRMEDEVGEHLVATTEMLRAQASALDALAETCRAITPLLVKLVDESAS